MSVVIALLDPRARTVGDRGAAVEARRNHLVHSILDIALVYRDPALGDRSEGELVDVESQDVNEDDDGDGHDV